MRDDVRGYVVDNLRCEDGVLIADDTQVIGLPYIETTSSALQDGALYIA